MHPYLASYPSSTYIIYTSIALVTSRITPPILPACPPPLLPLRTVKALLPQLLIHRIVRLAHPRAELIPIANSWRILRHPFLEVFRADPAWVQLAEGCEEGLGLGL